jgi:hypothetical protein
MRILKYINDENNFCLVHKTKIFIYYLLFRDKQYYYFETYLKKNFQKTKEISGKLLKKEILKTEVLFFDDFIVSGKSNNFLSQKINDYHIVTETFGNEEYVTFCLMDKNLNKIKEFKGQRYSPTFISSYILFKFNLNFSLHLHSFMEYLIKDISEKDKLKLKKYSGILFYKYKKFIFDDIKVNFDLFWYSGDERFIMNIFLYYDKIIKINKEKIISYFMLNDKEKKISYIYYAVCFFSSMFIIDFIKTNNIKNSKIAINSCLFKINICKKFLNDINDTNEYYFSDLNNLKNGLIFFTDKKFFEQIKLIKNKYEKKILEKMK